MTLTLKRNIVDKCSFNREVILVKAGSSGEVIDIIIEQDERSNWKKGIAFLIEFENYDSPVWVDVEDIEDNF